MPRPCAWPPRGPILILHSSSSHLTPPMAKSCVCINAKHFQHCPVWIIKRHDKGGAGSRLGVSVCKAVVHTPACEANWEAGAVGAELSCADGSGLSPPPCRVLHTHSGHGTTCIGGSSTTECNELQIFAQCVGTRNLLIHAQELDSSTDISETVYIAKYVIRHSAMGLSRAERSCSATLGCDVCRSSRAH